MGMLAAGRMDSIKVLFLHPAAAYGGASKSLIELFQVLKDMGVQGSVLTPAGSVCNAFEQAGLEVRKVVGLSQFDNTRYGYYRHLRWLIVLREIFFLPFSLRALWLLRDEQFDILHVNEVTLLPIAIVAKRWFKVPMVVHVRSLQRKSGEGLRTHMVNRWLEKYADAVVAIDQTVAGTLAPELPVSIVHNGLRVENDPENHKKYDVNSPVCVGFMGVLIPLKGIFELVLAMIILKERGVNVECVIAGENARKLSGIKAWGLRHLGFARDVRAELESIIESHGLQKHVRLLGFVKDVRILYPQLDILCFPSHLDAAGRPIFEAAFYSVPSIVAVENPKPDAIVDGVTGVAIVKSDPVLIADAIQRLVEDHNYRERLGQQAKCWANENFSLDVSAKAMSEIYQRLSFQYK